MAAGFRRAPAHTQATYRRSAHQLFGLDVAPEKLPADIAGEAERLWQTDPRAALALLYRGLLSRLLHDFQLPLNAHTEGEVLQQVRQLQHESLAARRAPHPTLAGRHGHRPAETEARDALCADWRGLPQQAGMSRPHTRALAAVAVLLLGLLIIWLASQLQPYEDVVEHGPAPEARSNPYLAAELFLRGLGLTVEHHKASAASRRCCEAGPCSRWVTGAT